MRRCWHAHWNPGRKSFRGATGPCESCARAPCKVPEQGRVQFGVKVVWTWVGVHMQVFHSSLTIFLIARLERRKSRKRCQHLDRRLRIRCFNPFAPALLGAHSGLRLPPVGEGRAQRTICERQPRPAVTVVPAVESIVQPPRKKDAKLPFMSICAPLGVPCGTAVHG